MALIINEQQMEIDGVHYIAVSDIVGPDEITGMYQRMIQIYLDNPVASVNSRPVLTITVITDIHDGVQLITPSLTY